MILPSVMRYYGYKLDEVLELKAVTFFSLANSMIKLKAVESLELARVHLIPHLEEKARDRLLTNLEDATKGADKYLEQARVVKNVSKS